MSTEDLHERLQAIYSLLEELREDWPSDKVGMALAALTRDAEGVVLMAQDEMLEET